MSETKATLTVGHLIEYLQSIPSDTPIALPIYYYEDFERWTLKNTDELKNPEITGTIRGNKMYSISNSPSFHYSNNVLYIDTNGINFTAGWVGSPKPVQMCYTLDL